jgi:hypothetical protein
VNHLNKNTLVSVSKKQSNDLNCNPEPKPEVNVFGKAWPRVPPRSLLAAHNGRSLAKLFARICTCIRTSAWRLLKNILAQRTRLYGLLVLKCFIDCGRDGLAST